MWLECEIAIFLDLVDHPALYQLIRFGSIRLIAVYRNEWKTNIVFVAHLDHQVFGERHKSLLSLSL